MPKAKKKKPRLTSIPIIQSRLFRLASQICRDLAGNKCEICGIEAKTIKNGKPIRIEAHHVLSRDNKDSPLKWDLRNLVALCTEHHKFGKRSAHKHGIWFAEEFKKIRPKDYQWILEHTDDTADLKDRETLQKIEDNLREKQGSSPPA